MDFTKEVVKKNMKKIGLIILMMGFLVFFTGCGKELSPNGELEGYQYEETEERTTTVKIVTNKDKVILIELYPDIAPITVENFQKLVSEKFYDGLIFHRVVEDFVIQTGDPKGTGTGGSEETIKGEFKENGVENNLAHEKGILSMARSDDMDSASSQFFICVGDKDAENMKYLNGKYAAFGKVIAGYDAVEEISKVSTDVNDKPTQVQRIKSIRFVNVDRIK